jgi:hypothetical protein
MNAARRKVVIVGSSLLGGFESILNKEADDGWRLHEVSSMVTLKGGSIFLGDRGYYFDPNVLVMVRTRKKLRYRCRVLKSANVATKDADAINCEIMRQKKAGFDLFKVLPISVIGSDPERHSKGTQAFMLTFESGGRGRASREGRRSA